MFTLATTETIRGIAGSATAVTYTLTGDEKGVTDAFKVLAQGQLLATVGTIYTVPAATSTLVQKVFLHNTTAGALTVSLYLNGAAAANRIITLSLPANGSATGDNGGWKVYDAGGQVLSSSPLVLTGDVTGSGAGTVPTTLATVNAGVGSFGSPTAVPTLTVNAKGLVTAAGASSIQILAAQVTGLTFFATLANLTGDISTTGSGVTTLPVVNANVGSFGSASSVATQTVNAKGQTTAAASVPIAIANTAVSGLGTLSTISNLTGPVTSVGAATTIGANQVSLANMAQAPALTLRGNNTGSTANVADLTLTQLAAMGVTGLSRWIDVTKQATPVLTSNTAAQNITAINAILTAADGGSTIYIPGGTYNFNAAWTMPSKQFIFQGQGSNLTGGYTILAWTSNVAGNFITLANSIWYTQFRDLNFVSGGVTQTAGAVVDINGNAGINFFNCSFSSTGGGFLFDVLKGDKVGTGIQDQSWNSAVISGCAMNSFKGKAIFVNSAASSLVVEKCVINGAWGGFTGSPAALQATAGIEGRWVGALQLFGCDILGCVNNLLLDPVSASSEVCASVVVTNCYFDNAGGSCIKIAGTGSTVRCRFSTCYFTTAGTNYTVAGTGLSAIEINSTATYIAGGQSVAFTDCNIYDTFSTAGTCNGVLLAGNWADVYLNGCNISGWTNGFNVTPTAGNISNLKVTGGAVGPSGGLGNNTVGFLIGAGAYKGLQIQNVNAHGNGTNLTLGAVTVIAAEGSQFRISDNTGINPRGVLTPPVATPVSTTVYTNTLGFRVNVFFKAVTTITNMSINGQATVYTGGGNNSGFVQLDPGGTFAYTFTGAGTWFWIAN